VVTLSEGTLNQKIICHKKFDVPTLNVTAKLRQNQNQYQLSNDAIQFIGLLCIISSMFLIVVPYLLYPELYTPKDNPAMGFKAPNAPITWAIVITALIILFTGIFILAKYRAQKFSYKRNWILH
jgi:hypothetical protein